MATGKARRGSLACGTRSLQGVLGRYVLVKLVDGPKPSNGFCNDDISSQSGIGFPDRVSGKRTIRDGGAMLVVFGLRFHARGSDVVVGF